MATKIYTKTGDKGMTSLFGGKRLSKDDIRIESYGTIDELNAFIGLIADAVDKDIKLFLRKIQNDLFDIGSVLACDPTKDFGLTSVDASDIKQLEDAIDLMNESLSPLKNFILPGGNLLISYTHIARTVCRRAERRVISLQNVEEVNQEIVTYINRLSDYLFVLSRYIAQVQNVSEIKWISKAK